MSNFYSTKVIELGSTAFRQWKSETHCGFIHGYFLTAKFVFGCSALDNKNWVVGFGDLRSLKKKLEDFFDHKLVISADDPEYALLQSLHERGIARVIVLEDGVGIEKFAELCFHIASEEIKSLYGDRCWVESVEVSEHGKNSAIYKKNI